MAMFNLIVKHLTKNISFGSFILVEYFYFISFGTINIESELYSPLD
jgi:hypothetical protein